MASKTHRYTVRHANDRLDWALRRKASERGVSLNTLMLQALETETGVRAEGTVFDDLDDLFGSWIHDEAVDRALQEQRHVELPRV